MFFWEAVDGVPENAGSRVGVVQGQANPRGVEHGACTQSGHAGHDDGVLALRSGAKM